jgi:hypothetical protein
MPQITQKYGSQNTVHRENKQCNPIACRDSISVHFNNPRMPTSFKGYGGTRYQKPGSVDSTVCPRSFTIFKPEVFKYFRQTWKDSRVQSEPLPKGLILFLFACFCSVHTKRIELLLCDSVPRPGCLKERPNQKIYQNEVFMWRSLLPNI